MVESTIAGIVRVVRSTTGAPDAWRDSLEVPKNPSGKEREMGRLMLWDDTNTRTLPTLLTVFEEWERCGGRNTALGAGHPARFQLLVGLARYATDVRTNKDSGSAANTALRFAEGKTTVDVFEE